MNIGGTIVWPGRSAARGFRRRPCDFDEPGEPAVRLAPEWELGPSSRLGKQQPNRPKVFGGRW